MKSSSNFIARMPRSYQIGAGAVIFIAVVAIAYHAFHGAANASTQRSRPASEQVTVASVGSLSPNNAPLSVIGKVTSQDEATILSETSGEIVTVNKQLGDQVFAGDVIATFENSSQQASVLQEEGAYNAANAALAQATGVTAVNSTITSTQANQSAANTQTSTIASLQSAFEALDDAVNTKADAFFTVPQSPDPMLIDYFNATTDGNVVTPQFLQMVENERLSLEVVLQNDQTLSLATSTVTLDQNISQMITDAETVQTFLGNLAHLINLLTPTTNLSAATIATYQTSIGAARTEVLTAISNLTTAMNSYNGSQASATTATNSATGGTNSAIAAAQAQVQEAQGAYDAAKSALAKTIVTSPIDGTIIALPVTTGDYVSSFSEVAEVSNPSALKVTAYVTATDASTIAPGNAATVNGTIQGTITRVAPAINPQTGTIEVDVSVPDNQAGLVDQDSVTVGLARSASAAASASQDQSISSSSPIIIPIVALKITPTGPVVFTVKAGSATKVASTTASAGTPGTLVSHSVSIGSILGDDIIVTQGLTPDMVIVTDARGLTEGELVNVKH